MSLHIISFKQLVCSLNLFKHIRHKCASKGYYFFETLYCNFLKYEVKSACGFIGGVVYTNKLVYYKFVPCLTETGLETGKTLRHFLTVMGLPNNIHSDNYTNFNKWLFNGLLRKFGICQTFTEGNLWQMNSFKRNRKLDCY